MYTAFSISLAWGLTVMFQLSGTSTLEPIAAMSPKRRPGIWPAASASACSWATASATAPRQISVLFCVAATGPTGAKVKASYKGIL